MKILVTGASGFVGQALCKDLIKHEHEVATLHRVANLDFTAEQILASSLDSHGCNAVSLKANDLYDYDVLVHLAARAHVMHETVQDVYKAYSEINVVYTLKVARLAIELKVKRFIFLSSIKVNGESTVVPFIEKAYPHPEDAYGQTKLDAEVALKELFRGSKAELVIIRPPLIYGVGVKANFKQLIKFCRLPIPLPFGAVHNKRSLIFLENLVHFIELCCQHPKAANETFLISDGYDVSTTELIAKTRKALNQSSWLIPIPQSWLVYLFTLLGKSSLNQRLFGNLQVDIAKAKQLLDWQAPVSFNEGIKKAVDDYVEKNP
ncbi:MAG TPA: NAD-dependent epimerase/dehydratase family protein [Methylophilaceae bacterium]